MQNLQCLLELLDSIIYVVKVEFANSVLCALLGLSDRFIEVCISLKRGTATSWFARWLLNGLRHRWLLLSIRVLGWRGLVVRVIVD